MGLTNLEEFVFSIFKSFSTKSRTAAIVASTPLPAEAAKELTIVLAVTGTITISGVSFTATAGVPYTFKHIASMATITTNQAGAVIYYQ